MRDITRRLAEAGYAALAADLLTGRNRAVCMARYMTGLLLGSVNRYGVALNAAAIGAPVWVAIIGFAQFIAGAAIAAGAALATSANAAGQVKTAAAAGGRTNLGWALGAPGAAGVFFAGQMDKS